MLAYAPAQHQGRAHGRRLAIVDVQGRGHETEGGQGILGPVLGAVGSGRRRARAVAVDQGRDEAAVDESGDRGVFGARLETADRFVALPEAADVMTYDDSSTTTAPRNWFV